MLKTMCAQHSENDPGLLKSVFTNRCPRCRHGKLFLESNPYKLKTTMRMPEKCPVCGQPFELQTGFYFGTGFVSYGLSVFLLGISFAIWYLTLGFSVRDNSVFIWLSVSALILILVQPVLQRWARSIWIAFFVRYNAQWRTIIQ